MKKKCFFATSLVTLLLIGYAKCVFAQGVKVNISWNKTIGVSKTTPTLQVVVNPLLMRSASVHDNIFKSLKELNADFIRFVPWFPYPHMAVAELRPPTVTKTYWDFSLIDPIVEDFMNATKTHSVMLNFSTIPTWMFKDVKDSTYLTRPKDVVWDYDKGTELRDATLKELVGYYVRLFSWYTKGGFTDELGRFHKSGHYYKIPYWEVLNEPDLEHNLSPQLYTRIYDAIVEALKKISPNTQFFGPGLAFEKDPNWFEYFLNQKNHKDGTGVDGISYHFYGAADYLLQNIDNYQYSFFDKADAFLDRVAYIESIRNRLSPHTLTDIDELGTMSGDQNGDGIDAHYWNLSGAVFAYTYIQLLKMGIDVVGESQLVGYPSQYPSVSMINWETGTPNARYRVLQLLIKNFKPGDKLVATRTNTGDIMAQAFIIGKWKKLLLINKRNKAIELKLPTGFKNAWVNSVDTSTKEGLPSQYKLAGSNNITLEPFSVTVITL